jgi:putative ABC transport system substrate-binding protein
MTGSAAGWAFVARAQTSQQPRRVGILNFLAENDQSGQRNLAIFMHRLHELGWKDGDNVRFDIRWGAGQVDHYHQLASELVAFSPDVLLAQTSPITLALQKVTRTVPIVFAGVIDPVGQGIVSSLAHPGGNTTGFVAFEFTIASKWLELLKELAPGTTRIAVLRDPTNSAGIGQFAVVQAMAQSGTELSVIDALDEKSLEKAVEEFSRAGNGGLIVTAGPFAGNHPGLIASLAAQHKLPAVYPFRYFVESGGLASYGPNLPSQLTPAADYVDRILRGERAADLPVQAPTKYELVIGLRTAKALGLTVPANLLASADEVIE